MKYEELIEKNIELEKKYEESHSDIERDKLYPKEWYSLRDYDLKLKILEEVIEENTTIINSELMSRVCDNMLNQKKCFDL